MIDFRMPIRPQNSNKGTFGKVLNVSGSQNYIGAAYLSSYSVLKIGAGYVALASCEKVRNSISQILPEAVYISRETALQNIQNYNAMLIGCGLGTDEKSQNEFTKFIELASKQNSISVVVDADGLNILSQNSSIVLPSNTIITPHPKEAARLLGVETEDILKDTVQTAKKLAEKYNCIAVLKTHRTVVCNTSGDVYINKYGNSALAKAGAGDVLAGIITGLTAQKMSLYDAAKLGVYLHSRSGEIASEDLTEYCVLAKDILNYLPSAVKELLINNV